MFQHVLEELKGSSADVEASALISTDGLMIASAAPTTFSRLLAGAITLGFFTYALQHGLRGGADKNRDRIITAKELFDYVSEKVKKNSGNRQHPVMWGKFSDDMPVMKW
jgi:uncharacterized caspase-like protein